MGYPFPSQAIDSQDISKTQRSSAGAPQASQIWPKVTGGWEWRRKMSAKVFRRLWREEDAQDIAEYAVMLAVILVIVVGTIRLIGGNANNVFSSVASSLAQ